MSFVNKFSTILVKIHCKNYHLSDSSRPSIIHSRFLPWSELQKTTESPWITEKESILDHWTRNLVNKLWDPTISGSKSLTRILLGPITWKKKSSKMGQKLVKIEITSQMTFWGPWGLPLFSRPVLSFFSPLSRFCHKFRCFSHSFKWAGVSCDPTIVVDLINWPNFSTWSMDWFINVDKWWLIESGVTKREPSIARPFWLVSSEKSAKIKYFMIIRHFTTTL